MRVPAAVGVNVTLIVQFALAANVAGSVPHVFVCVKSPEGAIVLIVKLPVPVLVSVTGCAALVVIQRLVAKSETRRREHYGRSWICPVPG